MTTHTLNDGSLLCWCPVNYHRDGDTAQLRAGLRWTAEDPYAVTVEFIARNTLPVTWVMSRDTLFQGCHIPSGDGDYQVFPASPAWVALHLSSPSGTAQFSIDTDTLWDFLMASFEVCPAGQEYVDYDMDTALENFLESEFWFDDREIS